MSSVGDGHERPQAADTRRVADPMHETELLFRSLTGEIRRGTDVAIESRSPEDWRQVARLAGHAQRKARELVVDAELWHELDVSRR